jgi:hypothetical protein
MDQDVAVATVEAWLARERDDARGEHQWTRQARVSAVREHPLGWLVSCQSTEYLRTGDLAYMLVGLGPILVDATDGSLHMIPVTTSGGGQWEDAYRHQVQGLPRPDPVARAISQTLQDHGTLAALREVRRRAPQMSIAQARAYIAALADHQTPPAELAALTQPPNTRPPGSIITLAPAPHPPHATTHPPTPARHRPRPGTDAPPQAASSATAEQHRDETALRA